MSENWLMELDEPVGELMSHSTMCPLSGCLVMSSVNLLSIMGLLLNCGKMLKTKLKIIRM